MCPRWRPVSGSCAVHRPQLVGHLCIIIIVIIMIIFIKASSRMNIIISILIIGSITVTIRVSLSSSSLPSTKTECDYLNGWIKKNGHIRKISPKSGEPQRYSWGTQKKSSSLPLSLLMSLSSSLLPVSSVSPCILERCS